MVGVGVTAVMAADLSVCLRLVASTVPTRIHYTFTLLALQLRVYLSTQVHIEVVEEEGRSSQASLLAGGKEGPGPNQVYVPGVFSLLELLSFSFDLLHWP